MTSSATLAMAEAEARAIVAERDLVQLAQPAKDDLSDLSARISDREWDVEVTILELSRVEVRLKADLIRWAERFAARRDK